MADIGLSVASKVAEFLVYPVLKQLKYLCCYSNNIQSLKNEMLDLEHKRDGVEQRVNDAKRNAEVIDKEVSAWLEKVDRVKVEANEVLAGTVDAKSRCSGLKSRYLLSRKAMKKTDEAVKLQEKGKFDKVGYPASANGIPRETSSNSGEGLKSRKSTRNEIMQALKDSHTHIIGIWGMAGVGKTTMVNDIVALVGTVRLFEQIAKAVVSEHQDVINVQDQLAESLGLKFEEKVNIDVRAQRLYGRIMQDDKSTLLIFDDLWQQIDLKIVGVPSPTDRKGLKIMLTSRFLDVCGDMRAQRNIEVEVLSSQEAWYLFQKTVGVSCDADMMTIAKDVAKECGGLPLAIVTVGNALRNKKKDIWHDAIKQLQNSAVINIRGMQDIVYKSIRLSYNFLGNDEAKNLLLHCSLFPEDHNIPTESLVRHGWGLKLFHGIETLAEARNRVDTIVDHLKNCCLLITHGDHHVKLHDVVRDVCLSIAFSKEQEWKIRHVGLEEWPEEDAYKDFAAISLTFNKLNELPGGSKFPMLKLLFLVCKSRSAISISGEYFEEMKDLRVIELNRMKIEIPSSIQFLTGLRTLCLELCIVQNDISILGSLKKLEILSFYKSYLDCILPIEIGQLSKLKSFDLRFVDLSGQFRLYQQIRNGVLLGLMKLEELYLGYIKGSERHLSNCMTAMSSLSGLSNIQICTDDVHLLLQVLHELKIEKLQRFHVVHSQEADVKLKYVYGRSLYLDNVKITVIKDSAVSSLLKMSDVLTLRSIDGWNNSMSNLDQNGFVNLKKLKVWHSDIKYLIDMGSFVSYSAFPNLKIMELKDLPALMQLWKGPVQPPSFCNLSHLTIRGCYEIRSVFSQPMVKCLTRLQNLEIYSCRMLEEIVSRDTQGNSATEIISFPKLTHLSIWSGVPNLRSFSCPLETLSSPHNNKNQSAFFSQVMLPSLETIYIVDCDELKWIIDGNVPAASLDNLRFLSMAYCRGLSGIGPSNWMMLLNNLQSLTLHYLRNVVVLFDFKSLEVAEGQMEILLGQLERLDLSEVTELKRLCSICPKRIRVFQNLKSISIEYCKILAHLFSPCTAKILVSLEHLAIGYCDSLTCIIEKETEIEEHGEQSCNQIILPKLMQLRLKRLPSFNMFCKTEKLELPSLIELHIKKCPAMEKVCLQQINEPKQCTVYLGDDISVPLDVFLSQLETGESSNSMYAHDA